MSKMYSKMYYTKYRYVDFLLKIYLHFHFHERFEIGLERFGI